MKKKIYQEIEIPEGIEVNIDGNVISIKGEKGENKREFGIGKLTFKVEKNKIILGYEKASKNEKKRINTIAAHINNMITGVQEGFEYELKICSGHFPMTVETKEKEAIIKNFIGEKKERKINLPEGIEIEINKEIIKIKAIDKEIAGQAAANFEKATKIRNKDNRIFQDGIYIVKKAGREL